MANVYRKGSIEARAAKALLHDLTYAAGIRAQNQRTNGSASIPSNMTSYAVEVCNEVLNRSFTDVDSAINGLSGIQVVNSLTNRKTATTAFNAQEIAKALVYLAECLHLYWDDVNATPYEVSTFNNTILGKTVATYGRFTSMLAPTAQAAPSSSSTRQSTPRTPGQPPKNGYKQSGAQSSNVRDLHGQPGVKVYAQNHEVYRIIADNSASKNIPNAFVRPLSSRGASGNTNAVFFNSGNGYTDMTCWFDDYNAAKAFMAQLVANQSFPSNISNVRIVKNRPDRNGYFLVGTVYGECAVAASNLNEALKEAAALEEVVEPSGWEKAGERMTEEAFDELHCWMRKD